MFIIINIISIGFNTHHYFINAGIVDTAELFSIVWLVLVDVDIHVDVECTTNIYH